MTDEKKGPVPAREVPTVTWGSHTPEEAAEFFGRAFIGGRMQFDPATMRRHAVMDLTQWYLRRGTLDEARALLTAYAEPDVDPRAIYDATISSLGRPSDFPSYEEIAPHA